MNSLMYTHTYIHTHMHTRDLHGDGDRGNFTEPAGIPQGWNLTLQGSRGHGNKYHGTPAGME